MKIQPGHVQSEFRMGALHRNGFRYFLETSGVEYVEHKTWLDSWFMVSGPEYTVNMISERVRQWQIVMYESSRVTRTYKVTKKDDDIFYAAVGQICGVEPTLKKKGLFKNTYTVRAAPDEAEMIPKEMELIRSNYSKSTIKNSH